MSHGTTSEATSSASHDQRRSGDAALPSLPDRARRMRKCSIGVFAYLLTQGRGMAERNQARANEARDEVRQMVGFSAPDEIAKLDRLKSTGLISTEEYACLRTKLVG